MSAQVRRNGKPSEGKKGGPANQAAPQRQRNQRKKLAPRRGINLGWVALGAVALVIGGFVLLNVTGGGAASQQTSTNPLIGRVTETTFSGTAASALLPVGTAAPDLQMNIQGTDLSLSGIKGNPVLLEFFATWCPHCQAEVPVISKVADQFQSRGLQVLAVSASPLGQDQRVQASMPDLESYVTKYGAKYRHFLDLSIVGGRRFGIRSFPTLYVIDANGIIQMARDGEVPEADLTAAITPLLKK